MLHRLSRGLREEMVAMARTGRTRLSQALLAPLAPLALLPPFLAPKATKARWANAAPWATLVLGDKEAALAPQVPHLPSQALQGPWVQKETRETTGCKELQETRAYQA